MGARAPVLVVDDDDDLRETVALVLETAGYVVVGAADGREALRWIEAHGPPSVILLDMMMPGMNGEEFLSALRSLDGQARLPIVIFSGDTRIREKAAALGVQGCLQKPVELRQIEEAVQRYS